MKKLLQLAAIVLLSILPAVAQTRTEAVLEVDQNFTGKNSFAQGVGLDSATLATLPNPPTTGVGTILYCSNCLASSPCTITGPGAPATWNGAAWNCGSTGGGGGSSISVNSVAEATGNFNNTTPAAGAGLKNVTWQVDGSGNISAEVNVGIQTFGGNSPDGAGNYTPLAADYGLVGTQQVGSGTMSFKCNATGTCFFGNTGNFIKIFPTANSLAVQFQDVFNNSIDMQSGTGSSGVLLLHAGGSPSGTTIDIIGQPAEIDFNFNGTCASTGVCFTATGTSFAFPITVPSCTGCGAALPDPFQFNSSLPVSLLASVIGKSGLRFDPTDGTLYMVDKAVSTSDPWGQVIVAQQAGATGNINSEGLIDQIAVGLATGQFQFYTLPNGALKYTTGAGGFAQASANDLTNTTTGTGKIVLAGGTPTFTGSPSLNTFTAVSGTFNGSGPTQLDMTYSGVAPSSPLAGHTFIGINSSNNLVFSINGGNQFVPGPSSAIVTASCGGAAGLMGPAANTNYIFFPANQSTTTCSTSSIGGATQEVPFPANGTIKNLFCAMSGGGISGDIIKVWVNNSATSLQIAIGTGTTGFNIANSFTVAAGDVWSIRYLTGGAGNSSATAPRCSFEFIRTP